MKTILSFINVNMLNLDCAQELMLKSGSLDGTEDLWENILVETLQENAPWIFSHQNS